MRRSIVFVIVVSIFISFGLTLVSSGDIIFGDWVSFLFISLLSVGLGLGCWWLLRKEKIPNWLGWLVFVAVLLRLGSAVLWYAALPEWGHGTEGELAGYIMSDAWVRDTQAWELASSNQPLLSAFRDFRYVDQYGGLLFFSSAVYRILGSDSHHPLLMCVITSIFSGLSILFIWAFTRRLWGESPARIASLITCYYPEAVLLGGSQMREPFMIMLAAMAFYGLLVYWQDHSNWGIAWVIVAVCVGLPLSYLFVIMLLVALIVMVVILERARLLKRWKLWGTLSLLFLVGMVSLWIFGDRIYPKGASNPLQLIQQWLIFAARWEERTAAITSGWLEKIFIRSPEWMNIWIILGYGSVQPFLPASIIATGNWLWRSIAIWRALGWTALLILLLYAPVRAGLKLKKHLIPIGISFLVWVYILISAYRGGGDQWDNPRYRVIFLVLQSALAGWVWVEQKKASDPWFRRVLIGLGLVFAWFVPWYLRRYSPVFTWSVIDLFKTLGLGFVSIILYWIWDWVRCQKIIMVLKDKN